MTTKVLIKTHNELARRLDQAELTTWKAGKEKLQARIDAMRELVAVDAELDAEEADPLAIPEAAEAFGDVEPDQVPAEAAEEPEGADQAPVEASEPVVESAEAPAKPGKGIGKLVESLLLDAEGFDYPAIVEMVAGEFPDAKTSTRSVASVAAALRRKGVEVPMRRKARSAAG